MTTRLRHRASRNAAARHCRALLALVALLSTIHFTSPSLAYDCDKAATAVEKAICADPGLRIEEDRLNKAYEEVRQLSRAGERRMLVRAQKYWLARRESDCPSSTLGLPGCIRDMTRVKIADLEGKPDSGPGSTNRIIPYYVFQDGDAKSFAIEADFFRYASPRTAGEKAFNAAMAKTSGNYKLGPHGQDSNGETYEIETFSVLNYASDRLVSAMINEWSSTGGAHGNSVSIGVNIDLAKGREIAIGDILPESAFPALIENCRNQIIAEKKERMADEPYDPATDEFLKDEVIAEHLATIGAWSIAETEVTIDFDAYAVGPYVEGRFACKFPTNELKKIAVSDAPLP